MIRIREYQQSDAFSVGQLIADTYSEYNLSFVPPDELSLFLGPFRYAGSLDKVHQDAIIGVIRSEIVIVAVDQEEIVGVLRGRRGRLASLFVRGDRHRQGIGRMLVERFEDQSRKLGVDKIKVAATLYAVPFYLAMGYKRSTGQRSIWSFEGKGLIAQPMKKILGSSS